METCSCWFRPVDDPTSPPIDCASTVGAACVTRCANCAKLSRLRSKRARAAVTLVSGKDPGQKKWLPSESGFRSVDSCRRRVRCMRVSLPGRRALVSAASRRTEQFAYVANSSGIMCLVPPFDKCTRKHTHTHTRTHRTHRTHTAVDPPTSHLRSFWYPMA